MAPLSKNAAGTKKTTAHLKLTYRNDIPQWRQGPQGPTLVYEAGYIASEHATLIVNARRKGEDPAEIARQIRIHSYDLIEDEGIPWHMDATAPVPTLTMAETGDTDESQIDPLEATTSQIMPIDDISARTALTGGVWFAGPGDETVHVLALEDGSARREVVGPSRGEVTVHDTVAEAIAHCAELTLSHYEGEEPVSRAPRYTDPLTTPLAAMTWQPFGSWQPEKGATKTSRTSWNEEAEVVMGRGAPYSSDDLAILSRFSGFGNLSAKDERGVLWDFYTSPPVARAVWQLAGRVRPFRHGDAVLEPSCGTGVFLEVAPTDREIYVHGVEIDERSAHIAQHLHPHTRIYQSSFEVFSLHTPGNYDYVVGNVPFGRRDARHACLDRSNEVRQERYFVERSLSHTRDGGVVALIVGPGLMNNKSDRPYRLQVCREGQFVGAVRLPSGSFQHSSTTVSPDILLFRRYPEEVRVRLATMRDVEFEASPYNHVAFVNGTYYEEHPENLAAGTVGTTKWGQPCLEGPLRLEDLDALVARATLAPQLGEQEYASIADIVPLPKAAKKDMALTELEAEAMARKDLTVGSFKTEEGRAYRLGDGHRWVEVLSANPEVLPRLESIQAIARSVDEVRRVMLAGEDARPCQEAATKILQEYRTQFGAYPDADPKVKAAMKVLGESKGLYEGLLNPTSPILVKDTIFRTEATYHEGTSPEMQFLMAKSRAHQAVTDADIRAAFPDRYGPIMEGLWANPDVFRGLDDTFVLREDFVAGEVYPLMDALTKRAEDTRRPAHARAKDMHAVGELKKAVLYEPLEELELDPRLSWVPAATLEAWIKAPTDDFGAGEGSATYGKFEGKHHLNVFDYKKRERKWTTYEPVLYFLNRQEQRTRYYDTATKNEEYLASFRAWAVKHPEQGKILEEAYNRQYHGIVRMPTKSYPLEIPDWNPEVRPKPNQWAYVHFALRQPECIIGAGVGLGKTYTGILFHAAMRQEHRVNKMCYTVPNNKVSDWVSYIKKALPGMKVGYIDTDGSALTADERRRALVTLANTDCEAVVLPYTLSTLLTLRPDHEEEVLESAVLSHIKDEGTARRMQEKVQAMERMMADGDRSGVVYWEDFGFDGHVVDEIHNFKNLFTSTEARELGLRDGARSERALSLYKKTVYQNSIGKRCFMGLTGTVLTNSPLEYFNMLTQVSPSALSARSIHSIDDFISDFVTTEEVTVPDWSGNGTKTKKEIQSFRNLTTLRDIFFSHCYLDKDYEAAGIKRPEAFRSFHTLNADRDQIEALKVIAAEYELFKEEMTRPKDERAAWVEGKSIFTYFSAMLTVSIDPELYDPGRHTGWENQAFRAIAAEAASIKDQRGGGQLIFCDRVFSGDRTFNLHDKLKEYCVEAGFPAHRVAILNGFTKGGNAIGEEKLQATTAELVRRFNQGDYDLIIGTTACMGEGLDLQANSSGVHHATIPYRPSDVEQRVGRVLRQGNAQDLVEVHTYIKKGTTEPYLIHLVESKAGWIDELLGTDTDVFVNPDRDGVDMQELMASLYEEWGEMEKATALRTSWQEAIEKEEHKKHGPNSNRTSNSGRRTYGPSRQSGAGTRKMLSSCAANGCNGSRRPSL